MKLEGKVAMISGGAGGLGRAIADAMAKEGARLSVCDIDEASMARLTAQMPGGRTGNNRRHLRRGFKRRGSSLV